LNYFVWPFAFWLREKRKPRTKLGVNLSDLTHVRVCDAQDLAGWNFPEPDLNEAARAADASREVEEQWLPVV